MLFNSHYNLGLLYYYLNRMVVALVVQNYLLTSQGKPVKNWCSSNCSDVSAEFPSIAWVSSCFSSCTYRESGFSGCKAHL